MTSLRQRIDLPFGEGFATLIGFYEPTEKRHIAGDCPGRWQEYDCPASDASFDVEQFIVGGIDILSELECLKVEYLVSFNRTEQQDFIEWFVEKHIDTIVDVCSNR